ncbi:MAG: hypothetical protein PHC70_05030 [Patescibacteria group bacterium]|nr:hypothetical protein [Patescibacteria group bacterium]
MNPNRITIHMSVKSIFASFALMAAVTASVFGICTVQHQPSAMNMDTMIASAMDNTSCPLSNVADFHLSEKYSQADPWVFWRTVTPTGLNHLISLKVPTEVNVDPAVDRICDNRSDVPITITSPPLAYAYSQGILNPKIYSIA